MKKLTKFEKTHLLTTVTHTVITMTGAAITFYGVRSMGYSEAFALCGAIVVAVAAEVLTFKGTAANYIEIIEE